MHELEPFVFKLSGKEICLLKLEGRYYAFSNICTHIGGKLSEGTITRFGRVICPYHKAVFDVTSGASVSFPIRGLTTHDVKVEQGKIFLRINPNAEKWREEFPKLEDARFL